MGLVYDYSLKISVRETENDQYLIVCGNIALSTLCDLTAEYELY